MAIKREKKEPGPVQVKRERLPTQVKSEPLPVPVAPDNVKKESPALARPVYRADLNASPPTLRATLPNGVTEVVPLECGPRGFCKAVFQCMDAEIECEVPNLVLATKLALLEMKDEKKAEKKEAPKKKKVADKKVKKEESNPAANEGHARSYSLMWYKRDKTLAVRQKYGQKRQVLSFGGKSCDKDKTFLTEIGDSVVRKILSGTSYTDAKKWAMERCT